MDLSRLSTQELAAELARRQQDAASAAVNADDARDEVAVLQRQLAEAQRGQDKPACEIDLTAIKARNAARTPGSYNVIRWPGDGHGWAVCEVDGLIVRADAIRSDAEADAAFFAGASRDIPALIAEVERLTMPNGTVTASVIAT